MKPDQRGLTSHAYPFAFPEGATTYGEILHHESVDLSRAPSVQIMPGREAYALFVTEDAAPRLSRNSAAPSGSKVVEMQTTDEGSPFSGQWGNALVINNPVERYAVQPDDLLIVESNSDGYTDVTVKGEGDDKYMVWPADQALPLGKAADGEDVSLNFRVRGIITGQGKLVTWQHMHNTPALTRDIVDLCVVDSKVQSALQLALLAHRLHGESLLGSIQVNPVAKIYLSRFAHGAYIPPVEPRKRHEFGDLSAADVELYQRLTALAAGKQAN